MTNQAHTITLTLDEQGQLVAKVEGIKGPACTDVTKWLQKLGEVTHDENTAEYHEAAVGVGQTAKVW